MSIIDAHTHFLPPAVQENLSQFSEEEPYWGLLLDPPVGKSIQAYASPERMIADMDAAGVDIAIVVGEYFQKSESCRLRNDQAAALHRRFPDRFKPLVTVQPLEPNHALDQLKRGLDEGFCGVGELNPYAQGFDLDSAEFAAVIEFCIEADWPINLHVNEEVGPYYLGKSTTPLRKYYDLAARFPQAKFVFAHWGGGLFFYELLPGVRRQLKNVWYDTAATPLQFPVKKIFSVALEILDYRKLLYGSDYPLRLYPRQQKEADMRPFLAEIEAIHLSAEVKQALLYQNAAAVYLSSSNPLDPAKRQRMTSRLTEILPATPLALLIKQSPQTVEILAQFGVQWSVDAPSWEPIMQAAAAAGLGATKQQDLINKLNEVIQQEEM